MTRKRSDQPNYASPPERIETALDNRGNYRDIELRLYQQNPELRRELNLRGLLGRDWFWALVQLKDGKHVRCGTMLKGIEYLELRKTRIWRIHLCGGRKYEELWTPEVEDFDAMDWEVLAGSEAPPPALTNNK